MTIEQQPSFSVKSFYEFLAKKKLMGVKCSKCGKTHSPPRPTCPYCGSARTSWVELSGSGKIATYTVIHVGPSDLVNEVPYVVGVVELDEGPKVTGRIIGLDPSKPESIEVKSRVLVDYITKGEKTVLAFRLVT